MNTHHREPTFTRNREALKSESQVRTRLRDRLMFLLRVRGHVWQAAQHPEHSPVNDRPHRTIVRRKYAFLV